jgi:hypothetical protein
MRWLWLLFISLVQVLSAQSGLHLQLQAPAGVTPEVKVIFPGGQSRMYRESSVIPVASSGVYRIEPLNKRLPDAHVDAVYGHPAYEVKVTNTDSSYTAIVKYDLLKGTNRIWTTDKEGRLLGMAPWKPGGQSCTPDIIIGTGGTPVLAAMDTSYNLWYWDNEYLYLIKNEHISSGKAKVSKRIALPHLIDALFNANAMRIDPQNRLWVSLNHERQLLIYSITEILTKETAKPALTCQLEISPIDFALCPGLNQVAVAGVGGFQVYALPDLSTSGTQKPGILTRTLETGTFIAADYDRYDNLWVSSENGGIYQYTQEILKKTTLQNGDESYELPTPSYVYWGIQCDNSGNLWAMPRWNDGDTMVDFMERSRKPAGWFLKKNCSYPTYNEHGKFFLAAPVSVDK